MRKDFGPQTWLYPMPVLIVGSYDSDGNPDAMNAAWGGVYDRNQVMLCLSPGHQTTRNIRDQGAFTVSFADVAHVAEADYVGLVSGASLPDKLSRAGLHAERSQYVNAPIITEFPMTLECRLVKIQEDCHVIGEIVNVSVDRRYLDVEGLPDPEHLQPISFDPVHSAYRVLGEQVGAAFSDGEALK